jgi:hypothetical protein
MSLKSRIDRLKSGAGKVGLLLNPLSGQVRKRKKEIQDVINHIRGCTICTAVDAPGFLTATEQLIQANVDLLVIVAGDGTSHAILSHLFTTLPNTKWPVLMIVPAGTTNMTPLDLGMRGKPEQILQRLNNYLQNSVTTASKLIERPVLCIEQNGQDTLYGMFFAVGLVARGVKFSRSSVKQIGITGNIFTFLIMLRSLIGMILGRNRHEWAPVKMLMVKEDGKKQQGTYLFALVSALDCLLLNIRPYWGEEAAPLHVTWVDQQRKKLWRSLWPLLSGKGHTLKEQDGYHSHNTYTLTIHLDDEYIVDGELYRSTDRNEPLRITATQPVTFLVL